MVIVFLDELFGYQRSIIIGRKGSGKTAIYKFMQSEKKNNFSPLLFKDYPWKLHDKYKESDDKELIQMGSYSLAEMYICKNEFTDIMDNIDMMTEAQAEAVLHMAILYFNKEEYNTLVKNIIRKFKKSILDLEMPISRLFYDNLIDLKRDKDFLIEIMNSDLSYRTIHAFVHYLEEESKSVVDYKDIILSMSYHLINDGSSKDKGVWGIESEVSKLIIGLYDETSSS